MGCESLSIRYKGILFHNCVMVPKRMVQLREDREDLRVRDKGGHWMITGAIEL
jgi:hypothetical protein